jgi:HEPN domain-containing protein
MKPPEEVKREFIQDWLAKANQDLETSQFLLASGRLFLYPICFHAQQAAEKYLKAYLTWRQIECSVAAGLGSPDSIRS